MSVIVGIAAVLVAMVPVLTGLLAVSGFLEIEKGECLKRVPKNHSEHKGSQSLLAVLMLWLGVKLDRFKAKGVVLYIGQR